MADTTLTPNRWQLVLRDHRLRLFGSAISLIVLAALAIVMISRAELGAILNAINTAHLTWLLVSLVPFVFGQVLRVARTKLLLSAQMRVQARTTAQAVLGGQVINWLSPVRIGDLWRIARTSEGRHERLAWTIAGVVIEKSADALILALFALIVTVAPLPVAFASPLTRLLITGLGGMLVATAITALTSSRAQNKITQRLPKAALLFRFTGDAAQPQIPVQAMRAAWVRALPVTSAIWICAVAANYALAIAFDINIGLLGHLLLMLALQTSTVFSPVPGNIGVQSLVAVGVFVPLGIASASAIAYGAALWALSYGALVVLAIAAAFWRRADAAGRA